MVCTLPREVFVDLGLPHKDVFISFSHKHNHSGNLASILVSQFNVKGLESLQYCDIFNAETIKVKETNYLKRSYCNTISVYISHALVTNSDFIACLGASSNG